MSGADLGDIWGLESIIWEHLSLRSIMDFLRPLESRAEPARRHHALL